MRLRYTGNASRLQWKQLKTVDHGSGQIRTREGDPAGHIVSNGKGFDTRTGVLNVDTQGTTQADGLTEQLAWWRRTLLNEYPSFHPSTHCLGLMVKRGCTPDDTAELILWLGVCDRNPGAGATGLAIIWRQGSLSASNAGYLGSTAPTFVGAGENLEAVQAIVSFSNNGAAWTARLAGESEGQLFVEDGGPATWAQAADMTNPLAQWGFYFGIGHGSVDSLNNFSTPGTTFWTCLIPVQDLDYDQPPPRLAKWAAGQRICIVIYGDSISDGVGGASAGSGDLLPANVTLTVDRVAQTNYPATAGIMPQLVTRAFAAGATGVDIVQRGVTAQYNEVTGGQFMREAVSYAYRLGFTPHLVVPVLGTNDGNSSQTQADLDIWPRWLRNMYRIILWSCDRARVVHVGPLAQLASHPFIDQIVEKSSLVASGEPGVEFVDNQDLDRNDTAHPSAASYPIMADRVWDRFAAMA